MTPAQRYRATLEFKPVDHLVRQEFYIWDEAIQKWKEQGLGDDYRERNLFNFDPPGATTGLGQNLGWCEPPFTPAFEDKVIRDDGQTEIIQDWAGRWLQVFKGRRHGFMPDYIKHPVSGEKDWEENVVWRLNPSDEQRYADLAQRCDKAAKQREEHGSVVEQGMVGGYMYLRALVGPEDLLYMLHDQPQLIHRMMQRWCEVMDTALARLQAHVELDEIKFAEDICYNHGLLISPAMWHEFLFPYYQQVMEGARRRQTRKIHLMVDTDGFAEPAVPLYLKMGMDIMMPWEVASGCDVVRAGEKWPSLVIMGGIDKRVLASGKDAIDEHLQHIMPAMVRRGGYIPTCDHGVPDNVTLENYLHYRRRICEMDH